MANYGKTEVMSIRPDHVRPETGPNSFDDCLLLAPTDDKGSQLIILCRLVIRLFDTIGEWERRNMGPTFAIARLLPSCGRSTVLRQPQVFSLNCVGHRSHSADLDLGLSQGVGNEIPLACNCNEAPPNMFHKSAA